MTSAMRTKSNLEEKLLKFMSLDETVDVYLICIGPALWNRLEISSFSLHLDLITIQLEIWHSN